jgi:hypothetical protein
MLKSITKTSYAQDITNLVHIGECCGVLAPLHEPYSEHIMEETQSCLLFICVLPQGSTNRHYNPITVNKEHKMLTKHPSI